MNAHLNFTSYDDLDPLTLAALETEQGIRFIRSAGRISDIEINELSLEGEREME